MLDQVSADVQPGQCMALVGTNGSGKSTLLRMIAAADPTDGGTICVDGREVSDTDPDFRRDVAYEAGDTATFPDLTLAEHLTLLTRTHRMSDDGTAVRNALQDAGIGDLGHRYPHSLSSGQGQRFALAAVFLRPARLLLLDEPERHLDAEGQRWIADRIVAATAAGAACVLATHSTILVDECADLVLDLGE